MSLDPKTLTPAELAFVDNMFPRATMNFQTALDRAEPWIKGRREALAESAPDNVGYGPLLEMARDQYNMMIAGATHRATKWRIAIEAAERASSATITDQSALVEQLQAEVAELKAEVSKLEETLSHVPIGMQL